jgi:hypothetical protein
MLLTRTLLETVLPLMPKFCDNGHQMEDAWAVCPYCQRTGFKTANSAQFATTRLQPGVTAPAPTARQQPEERRTLLLSERRRPALAGWVVALNGEHQGEDFRLREGQNTLGAHGECHVRLRDATVSARHASLRMENGRCVLTDLDSTNGTFVNVGKERIAREEIRDNDTFRLGDVVLKLKCL